MTSITRASLAPQMSSDTKEWERTFHTWVTGANRGHISCTGRVTLDANANATTVTDSRAGPASYIGLMPVTASAAVEWKNIVIAQQGNGAFQISHQNNAVSDRTYVYCIMG